MKNIIIVGASRSGKTTLAQRIAKELRISHFPFDAIVSTLEELYPNIGIMHEDDNSEMSKKLSQLLSVYMKHLDYEDINYLIDLYQIYPKDLDRETITNNIIIYLGYPYIDPIVKLAQIKEFSREKDWTNNVGDREMIGIINLFINENRIMYEQCKEIGIPFFDISQNFEDSLSEAYHFVLNQLKAQ